MWTLVLAQKGPATPPIPPVTTTLPANAPGGFATTGQSSDALEVVKGAIGLSQDTFRAWNKAWTDAINPVDGGLWSGLVSVGLILAMLSILYVALKEGKDVLEKQSWSELVNMIVWPIVVLFFLGNNGSLLAQTTLGIRNIGYAQTQKVLNLQLGETQFRTAISKTGISNSTKEAIQNLYTECGGLVGEELTKCWQSKQPAAEAILAKAEGILGGAELSSVRSFLSGVTGLAGSALNSATPVGAIKAVVNPGEYLRSTFVPIIRAILFGLQWMVANVLEASLLLTALFAPIAMGLSLLPFQGRPIIAWLTGFISLFGVQLGYNIVVGLVATTIVNAKAEVATDIGFAMLLAIGAPGLAIAISTAGGMAVYRGLSSSVKQITDFYTAIAGGVTRAAIGMAGR